jgi:hypothetical protein
MIPLVIGLVFLVLALIYALYFKKTESFADSLSDQPPEIVNLVFVTKDIPNAADRAMAIFMEFQAKKVTADQALTKLYNLFMEGEASYNKTVVKPYVSYFTDALDFASKEMVKDKSMTPEMKASLANSIINFKAKLSATATPTLATATPALAAATPALAALAPAAMETPIPAPSESRVAANAASPTAPAPVMPPPSDARTVALINQELNARGIVANGASMKVPSSKTAEPDSDALEQGVEYDNALRAPTRKSCKPVAPSCPEDHCDSSSEDSLPAPVNMNAYIRKDSIPCWGCTLPTTP